MGIFARNVTGCEGLGALLIDAARAELDAGASETVIEEKASGLLLQVLCSVGIDPRTERLQRERLSRLLSGSPLSSDEVQRSVDYVLAQMVVQPKGALAECLGIRPSVEHLQTLKPAGIVPAHATFKRGIWSRRILHTEAGHHAVLGEWREGADGLFCAIATSEMEIALDERRRPEEGDLLIFGVSEVKCYRHIPRRRLRGQLDRHLARLAAGLQFRDWRGRAIESEYPPDRLWYATSNAGRLRVLPVTDAPFRLPARTKRNDARETVIWTHPMMEDLIRLSVGPRADGMQKPGARARPPVFDATIPYDQEQLEELGVAMAHYTLGAMADQPDIDLSGAEWSRNIKRALDVTGDDGLSSRQLARREKLLRRLG